MEVLAEPPHFDGKKWKCACGALLATVEKDEREEFDSTARRFVKRPVATLEIPAGYLHHKGRDVWVKPENVLGFQRGAQERTRRRQVREFTQGRLETGRRKNDPSSVGYAEMQLRQQEATRRARSTPRAEASAAQVKRQRFASGQFPIRIQCSHTHCKHVWLLRRIRGAIQPFTTQERAR